MTVFDAGLCWFIIGICTGGLVTLIVIDLAWKPNGNK